jgi:hypothetical protein
MGKFLGRFGWGTFLIGLLDLAAAGTWVSRIQGFMARAEVASSASGCIRSRRTDLLRRRQGQM